jgi:hypothetical protein
MSHRGPLAYLFALTMSLGGRAALGQPEVAAPSIRQSRRVLLAVGVPDVLWIRGHDATMPLPTVRLGVNLSPVLSLDLTGGGLPVEGDLSATVHLGLRWYFARRPLAPYVVLRAGTWMDRGSPNEGGNRSYPFAALGGGVEQTWNNGLTLWTELGPALVSYMAGGPRSWAAGVQGSAGIGLRL